MNKTFKAIIIAIVIIILATFITGLCLEVFGKGNQKPSSWFNNDKNNINPSDYDNTQFIGGLMMSDIESNSSIKLSAMAVAESTAGETYYTLEATVQPSNAVIKSVNFYLEWENSNSSFAQEKLVTNYIELIKNGENTCAIHCIQPFGERIKVIARSDYDSNIKAECKLDYLKRIEGFTLGLVEEYDGYFDECTFGYRVGLVCKNEVNFYPIYSDGTVFGGFKINSIEFNLNDDLLAKIRQFFEQDFGLEQGEFETMWENHNTSFATYEDDTYLSFADFATFFKEYNKTYDAWLDEFMFSESTETYCFGRITIDYTTSKGDIVLQGSEELDYNFYFEKSTIGRAVDSVELDKTEILF